MLSKNNWSCEDMKQYIQSNVISYKIRVRDGDIIREKRGRGICIGGHSYLVNNHCVQFEAFEMDIIFQNSKDGITQNFSTLVTPIQIKRFPEKDQCYINIPSIPPKRDLRKLFAKSSFEGRFDGLYVSRDFDGSMVEQNFRRPRLIRNFEFHCPDKKTTLRTSVWEGIVDVPTTVGECGTVLIIKSPLGPMILGLHTLGSMSNVSSAISVTYEDVCGLSLNIISNNVPTLQVGAYKHELTSLSVKATSRYIQSGTMQVFGSLTGFRSNPKSRVAKTLLSDCAVRDGYSRKTGAPVMNSYVPWRRAMLDMARPVSHIDLTLLKSCVDAFTNDILKGLSSDDLSEVKIYNLNTAINGKPGLAYVDKIPRNTSAGFPFRKSKKFFLEAIEAFDDYQHPVRITPEIEKEMDNIMLCYNNSTVYCPVFTASLKDEPISLKKIDEGKTRVFCGAPLPWSLVVRMHLLSVIRLIQKKRFLFEAGPGTIAQSTEWDAIYKYITHFGDDRIVAGDYGKFDKRMPASVILAAFDIIISILREAGWDENQIRVVSCIAEDTAFPTIDFHGELIRCYGTNPSGHPLTVIVNGLANSLYVRYCYASNHPGGHCIDFKNNVNLMTYGDDMIMGVSKNCTWLDHTKMQTVLAAIDIEFTMADKNAVSVPFIHISDATFLRRTWRYEPEVGYMVCPIEHDSIEKMLTMCVLSKSISPEIQALAVLDTACREYFWYGKDTFLEKRNLFYSWIDELDLEMYMERELPTWEQLVNEFQNNSELRGPRIDCQGL
nr:MAG: structural polyprotein [Crogonang virus 161]